MLEKRAYICQVECFYGNKRYLPGDIIRTKKIPNMEWFVEADPNRLPYGKDRINEEDIDLVLKVTPNANPPKDQGEVDKLLHKATPEHTEIDEEELDGDNEA